jgi:hypothetical protein
VKLPWHISIPFVGHVSLTAGFAAVIWSKNLFGRLAVNPVDFQLGF